MDRALEGTHRVGKQVMLYRADKRVFLPWSKIATAGSFIQKHPLGGKEVEEMLEASRPPDKLGRADALFLFENQAHALEHCVKMTGGRLYKVSVPSEAVTHRADMRLVDAMLPAILAADFEVGRQLAEQYWAGRMDAEAVVEVLVHTASVSCEIPLSKVDRLRLTGVTSYDPSQDEDDAELLERLNKQFE